MLVLSHPLMDCGCSSACVAYKNGELSQFMQTSINYNNCNSPETVKGVGWRLETGVTHSLWKFSGYATGAVMVLWTEIVDTSSIKTTVYRYRPSIRIR